MKYKKTIILLALVVFLLSIAGVSASEIDNTIASENANTIELSTDNDIEDNLQTSEENEALASTDYDEDIAQTDTEVLGADSAKYSDLAEEISQPGNITLTHKSYTYDERATAITISEANKVIDGNGAVIDMNGLTIRAFTVTASGVTIKNLTIKNANYNVNGGAIYFNSTGTVTNCNFTNNKATGDYSSGGAIFFVNTGTVTNCNFTNNKATGDYSSGGAISFSGTGTVSNCSFTGNTARNGGAINMGSGTVSNCNFTDNTATYEGGAVWMSSGTVSNCNFTNNTARYGGAVCFNREGAVTNCNFTNNSARYGGAVEFDGTGNVTNCNFTGNTAIDDGGAVFFLNTGNVTNCNFADNHASGDGGAINMGSGTVTNCNFADNTAYRGGAIFSNQWYTAADTCIFKRNSGDNVNTVIYLPTLNVDNFTTVYGSGEKLTFDLKTNSSIPVTNGNILISVYFKDNGEWVRNYTCLSGEGWIPDLPVGSYIAVFNTEYAEFQRINRTIIITLPNVRYSINVTSLTTNNKTVNITSKTDIPKDILWDGKLLFILPNSEEINASYATNGTWWALYTFNDAGDYNVNASYTGLDGVIINNATISIKYDTSVDVNNKTLDLLIDDTFTIVATTTPEGLNVTFTPDNSSVVSVDENGLVTALKEGTASITVKVGGDSKYTENSTTVAVTVSKIPTEITVNPASLNMFVGDETVIVANLTPADAGNVTFTSDDENIVIVDDQGNVIANGKGQAIITVIFEGDNKYAASENKTITVDVSLNDASVTVDNDTLDLKVDETYAINATKHPDTILLDITYKSSNDSVATVDKKGIVTAVGEGTAIITLSVGDDEIYAKNSTNVSVTVSKIPTEISADPTSLDLLIGNESQIVATLTPRDAGNVTFTSNDEDVVTVDANGNIIAVGKGNATITLSFEGDEKYAAAENKTISVNVNLKDANISIDAPEIIEGENATVTVTLPEDATGNVSIGNESIPVQNATASAVLTNLPVGNTSIPITYSGDDKYNPAMTTVNITVNKNTLNITAEDLTKYYKDSEKFAVTVTDARGQAVSNKTVEITINGVTYNRTTDENGTAKLNINLNSGEYPVSVAVDDIIVNSTVTVKSTIDAADVIKIFRNDTQYYAKFIDSNTNILANTSVSFNINGIIYNRTTDGNGTAKLNINLDAGDYIITATNTVTGEMKSNTIKVISLIESNDLTKYYRNASQFVVRIHSADGGYIGAGENVTFNINGVFYTRTTNATGHAKLNINLGQGNYTITTYYKDCSKGNNIEVLPILIANDLEMKYMDGSQFKAKLVDDQGKAYAGQSVQFNVNGVFYNSVTGSDGVAKLNINLMAGEYIITSSYNGFNTANKITIRG